VGSKLIALEAPVAGTDGEAAAFVRLQLRPHAGAPEQASASASLARVAEALSQVAGGSVGAGGKRNNLPSRMGRGSKIKIPV